MARRDGVDVHIDVDVHRTRDLAHGCVAGAAHKHGVCRALMHRQHYDIRRSIGRVIGAELVGLAIDLAREVAGLEV